MKFTQGLIAGSLALGLMVSGARADEPEATICVLPAIQDQAEITIDAGDPILVICDLALDEVKEGDVSVEITDGEVPLDWVLRNNLSGTDDDLIFATTGTPVTSPAVPVVTTDAGKDEATADKAAGVSAPAKSIASVSKRTSAVVKSGRVFLTH